MRTGSALGDSEVRDQLHELIVLLEDEFGRVVDQVSIRREAAIALAEFGEARLTEFVPILAWRRARGRLRDLDRHRPSA